ncbi:hypothetical protein AB0D71_01395 [Streptomyces avermitilis]|uniref:hypothetical protein n=1 Tax=Streptomyces avermitilis TaxID=33903 RepID=UPI0033FB32C9
MTQSGQGEEPSARPAREGIVLPSDGGAPLLPGTTGDQRPAPAGGQAWGQPWGPDGPGQTPPAPGWGAPADAGQPWTSPEPSQSAPAPDWGTSGAQPSWEASQDLRPGWDGPQGQPTDSGYPQQQPHQQQAAGSAFPAQPHQQQPQPQYEPDSGFQPQSHQAPAPGFSAPHGTGGAGPLPPEGAQAFPSASGGAPLPPVDEGATQYLPPVPAAQDEGATQYLPPVPAVDEGATQYIPPVPAVDEGATQFIPPVAPGALPPEVSSGASQFLGGAPGAGSRPAADPDAQATQYLPPVPAEPGAGSYGIRPGAPDERQPPAEFDNLFRSDSAGASSTQQLPQFQPSAAPGAPGAPGGRAAARRAAGDEGGGRGGRTGSRVPLIAAVGVGIAVLGIGAGALLSTGGDSESKGDNSKPVSATAPAKDASASASADPAKEQAVALNQLLADSGNSRDSVIKAVGNVRTCNNLDQAAGDLRDAAKQRGELVTRLSGLSVDKLPNHAALTAALTSAWQASASADTHYAAWADQVNGKKGCKKGQARTTGQTVAGNRASTTASAQKVKAAGLWNTIASTYGLTQRQPTQL